jgi:hypothetical protein
VTASLAANAQWTISETIAYLKNEGLSIPSTGTLLGVLSIQPVNAEVSQLAVVARTTTQTASGQAGLAYSAIPVADALNGTAYLCGLRENSTDRSNLAVENLGTTADGEITLRLTVFNGDPGASQVLPDVTLSPGQFAQISGILAFNGLNLTNGYVRVERVNGTAPFYAYAVINDQGNSDGSFLPPTAATQGTIPRLILPVVVETGAFKSEVMLTNYSEKDKTINFDYSAEALTTPSNSIQFSTTVRAGEQVSISEFIQYLRQRGIGGLPSAGVTLAGPLVATSSDGDLNGIFLGVRTSTPGDGGSFGVFNAAIPDSSLSTGSAWLFGLQQDTMNRSNLALVNLSAVGGASGTFTIDIYEGSTGIKAASFDQVVKPMGWLQLNSILAQYAPNTTSGYVQVTRQGSSDPFILYGVINDGGAPGERTGDGAFLASRP